MKRYSVVHFHIPPFFFHSSLLFDY
jgi:hypothetical protein